jgi:uncharacterized RDD family membrane protein YckC
MYSAPNDPPCYAGFWPRLGAQLLDSAIFLPLVVFSFWGNRHFRLFRLYYLGPDMLFNLFYYVYIVQRFGGTPGKLVLGLRIRKLGGDAIGYKEALLRCGPILVLGLLLSFDTIYARIGISDADFHSFTYTQLIKSEVAHSPFWRWLVDLANVVWILTDIVVFFTNQKRRALHDFIAGTVVVRISRGQSFSPNATSHPQPR